MNKLILLSLGLFLPHLVSIIKLEAGGFPKINHHLPTQSQALLSYQYRNLGLFQKMNPFLSTHDKVIHYMIGVSLEGIFNGRLHDKGALNFSLNQGKYGVMRDQLKRCYEREQEHTKYICAYHGCSGAVADLQDFYNALYQKNILKKKKIDFAANGQEQWVFLRNPFEKIDTSSEHMKMHLKNNKAHRFDHQPHIQKMLLSASVSPYDAATYNAAGGCCLSYCVKPPTQKAMTGHEILFDRFVEQKHIQMLHQSNQLLQIFIPEDIAQKTVYQAVQFGECYHYQADNYQHKANIITFINDLRAGKIDYNNYLIPSLRIALNSLYFANPKSGIKMYRYAMGVPEEITKTQQERTIAYDNF